MSVVSSAVGDTASAIRLVFANRNLRRVNLALAGSAIGDWAYATAVVVFAYRFGGPTAVGTYIAIRLALVAVGLPFTTVLVDRIPRKLFMIATDLIRAVLVAVAAVVIWGGGPPLVVLVVSIVAALVGAPFRPAQAALLPSLADTPQELTATNAVSSTLESLSFFVGPALAGLLLGVADVPVVFLLNAATFAWSALMISGLRLSAPEREDPIEDGADEGPHEGLDAVKSGFLQEAMAGFGVIGTDRRLLLIAVLYCAQTLIAGASTVYVVVIAVQVVRIGPEGVGFLDAVLGIGAIVGGFVAIARSSRGSVAKDFGVGVLIWTAPVLLIATVPLPAVAFLAMALIGLANPLVDVNAMTLVQRLAPESAMGRVFGALESVLIATMALGAFLMPFLIDGLGLRWSLTVISAPMVALTLLSFAALRRLDRTVIAPPHLDLIRALPLFQPLPPAVQEVLVRGLSPESVPAGTVVIRQGEPGDLFYLIESGSLEATQHTEDGAVRTLSQMGAGDCFGEIALLRDVPRTATVTATTDAVLQTLSREDFLAAVGAEPEVGTRAESLVSLRLSR
ncbi:MAG: MFS transporter [Propionibacteriaceae bacterium]